MNLLEKLMSLNHAATLARLRSALESLDQGSMGLDDFLALWRDPAGLLDALPSRFREVLDGTLMRLESSRFFSGDSCSFSRNDLTGNLALWLDKAEERLAAPEVAP